MGLLRFLLLLVISLDSAYGYEVIIDDTSEIILEGPLPALIDTKNEPRSALHWLNQTFSEENYQTSVELGPNTAWYKIRLRGQFSDEILHIRTINVQTHVLKHLNFYLFEDNNLIKQSSQGLVNIDTKNKPYQGAIFQFEIKNEQQLTLLIEKQSNGPANLPMNIYDQESFEHHIRNQYSFWVSIISVLLVMAFFNVLIYAMHPSSTYLWYLVFHISSFLYLSATNGFGFLIWPNAFQIWISQNIMFLGSIMVFFGLNFLFNFLEIKKYINKYAKLFLPLKILSLLFVISTLIFYEYQTLIIFAPFLLLVSIFSISMGIISLRNGFRPAKYFIISWIFPITGGFIEVGLSTSVIPSNFFTLNAFLLGTFLELFLLSIALASRIKHAENQLLNQLYIFPETEIANFSYLKKELPEIYKSLQSNLENPFIIIADLDGYKEVASLYGPKSLTQLFNKHTKTITKYLKKQLWSVPLPMPDGNSTYLISLPAEQIMCLVNLPMDNIDFTLAEVMNQIMDESDGMLSSNEFSSQIKVTLGCAELKGDIESSYRQAQVALLTSLRLKNRWTLYSHEHEKMIGERTLILHELKFAIKNKDLAVFIQPKYSLNNQVLAGGEALIRWKHKDFGDFDPSIFIPLAEQSGIIFQITQLVISDVFCWLSDQNKNDALPKDFNISINLSALDMSELRLTSYISSRLDFYNIKSKWITFEITESATQNNPEQIIQTIKVLKLLGFKISIDDFGTGYSSMVYLQNIQPDEIKIDIAFVRNIHTDQQKQHIVRAIVELARSNQAKTVAEGIESEDELQQVKALRCDEAQGFYWSPAIPLQDFTEKYLSSEARSKKTKNL